MKVIRYNKINGKKIWERRKKMSKDLTVLKSLGYGLGNVLYDIRTGKYYIISDVNGNVVLKERGTENRYALTMLLANKERFRKV